MGNNQVSTHINRREALKKISMGIVAGMVFPRMDISASVINQTDKIPQRMPDSEWSRIRGFNYQPSYGSTGFELWHYFDAKIIETELERGKRFFPKINALRWWQSWDAFLRNPKQYVKDFESTLNMAENIGCRVIPCLFNRWHSDSLDYGGIYIDHFLPKVSWVQRPKMFDKFLKALIVSFKKDQRILAWDLCNEPFAYSCQRTSIPDIFQSELDWLKNLYDTCKGFGAQAPITVGTWMGLPIEIVDSISDLLTIHPYYLYTDPDKKNTAREEFDNYLDKNVAYALKAEKPLLVAECCWGALDDNKRVEFIRYSLEQIKKRNLGWLAYLLHHSLVADAHRPEFGPVGSPGDLAFIEADGTLRPGHEVFNEF